MNDLRHPHPQAMSGEELTALFEQVSNWGRWGPDDERGALNHIGAAEVARAAALVREGRTVSLSRDFPTQPGPENPWPAQHHMVIAGDDPCVPGVDGLEVSTDYIGIAFHGMASSHIDALCHVFAQGRMYNDHPATEVKSTGARRNTIMAARDGIVGRGVLLDVPRALGVAFVDPEHLTTAAELQATEAALGVTVGKGDLLMVRLGRDVRRAAMADQAVPGLDPRVVAWLHERQVAVLGGDGVHDPIPSGVVHRDWAMPIHMLGLAGMGLHLMDNLDLEPLAEVCAELGRWTFQLVAAPLRIAGGTGSPLNPIAIF
ncbi:cyclase family protein [Phenylobacterium hankyongense]|uniref:Cyclase family protein n=1 Tax=Phenylobacterium hankyongense TaxID=1813876 RepID=A0A328B027_9CAUL|nr:cyclase family protein [Phenylobacterium hankyongense]RAK60259.1 cyclase family protein [Phenylobacterium hankyongense]